MKKFLLRLLYWIEFIIVSSPMWLSALVLCLLPVILSSIFNNWWICFALLITTPLAEPVFTLISRTAVGRKAEEILDKIEETYDRNN